MTNTNEGSVGDCNDDAFTVTSGGNTGSPMICGINTGQHCKIFLTTIKQSSTVS